MSTIAYNKIISKLQALDGYVRYLKDLQKTNKKSFLKDYHIFGLTEHYLHLSIEVLLDVSKLLVVIFRLPRPEEPREVFPVLCEHHVISKKLTEELHGITGFRNILIHEYEKIDKELVYDALHEKITQFQNFKKEVLKFLAKKK